MCGINGFVSNINCKNTETIISSMNSCIVHRGPDDFGVFVENVNTNSVAMSMRRLSIIDIKQGKQPIYSDDKNLIIVFNGEIYNYLNLKNHLKKKFNTKFHTNSDTEVILKLYEVYNTEGFSMLDGMFAFSIYDKKLNKIFIARDFFGEKPLYYFLDKNKFYWASELKSIAKVIDKRPKICQRGLSLYFQLTYIPSPYTIYKDINKLEANHYLEFDIDKFNFTINKIRKAENLTSSSNISFKNAKKITFDLVMESVKSRSVSDVKVGAFLSGGVDSSIISLCHSLNQKNKIDTFSLGFKNKSYDESNKFRTISNHLNSNHNEIFVDLKDNVFDIDRLLLNYDEPFADSSAIPTFLISKYTSNKVKVVLSGDGGDEVFGGYNKYLIGNINNFYTRLISKRLHKKIKPFLDTLLYESKDKRGLKHKLKKVINSIDFDGKYYEKIISLGFSNSELTSIIKEGFFIENILSDLSKKNIKSISDFREFDRIISLEGDMLVKVDRATMLNSLECRAPFLNYKLWDFISGLPENYLINNWRKKHLLKESFRKYFPKNFLDKPKKGFEIPVGDWLKNNFKVELLSYIEEEFLTKQKIFNVEMIQELVIEHIESRKDNTFKVWTFFCFQKWYKNIYLSL